MNQKSGQNSLGLDNCFEDEANPVDLFKKWFAAAEKSEINDPNALSVATTNNEGIPSVRMVLLKGLSDRGFVFYTNFNSKKGNDLKSNPNASMCFYWKSIKRQVRISGKVSTVEKEEADKYFSSRDYGSKIGAWASEQSKILRNKIELLERVEGFKKTYPETENVPRPENWSGLTLKPTVIEFWLKGPNRIHERLRYNKQLNNWEKKLLNP